MITTQILICSVITYSKVVNRYKIIINQIFVTGFLLLTVNVFKILAMGLSCSQRRVTRSIIIIIIFFNCINIVFHKIWIILWWNFVLLSPGLTNRRWDMFLQNLLNSCENVFFVRTDLSFFLQKIWQFKKVFISHKMSPALVQELHILLGLKLVFSLFTVHLFNFK